MVMAKRKRIKPQLKAEKRRVLDGDFIKKFCGYLKEGMPIDSICDYMSVDGTTFYDWVRKGEGWIDGGQDDKATEVYGLFVQQMRKESANYRFTLVRRLSRPANRQWRRELAILERRDRRNYGKQEQAGGTIDEYNPDEKFL